jgi:NhaP-type Na+/H+ or K+/H+ antiporter
MFITVESVQLILLVFSLVGLLHKSSVDKIYTIVKCGIAALCCVFMRCVGEFPSTQQKMHQRKIKTANNSHFTTEMKQPPKY